MSGAGLVLGPLLRYAGTESATFWVETDAACDVEILGHRTATFAVEGHHYALLLVDDLEPASVVSYDVRLDGELVWPPDDGRPRPTVHTRNEERQVRLVFGSCRVGDPQPTDLTPPWPDELKALGIDALWTYSKQLQRGEIEWPDALLLLGDQVYADEVSAGTLEFIRRRRGTDVEPGEQIADFEEYTQLYRETWSDPDIRWLLSTVPTTMIFDDHDVHDDWNISWLWVEEMRRKHWWDARITGAFMSYWIYQHLGNLSPPELDAETTLPRVRAEEDAGPLLRELARQWDRESAASRWAFYRDFGDTRLLVLDSRAARVLSDGRRQMIDDDEWDWIVEHSVGEFDHIVIASTLPVFLPTGIHHLQSWNETLCAGRWGGLAREPERAAAPRGRPRALGGLQPIVRAAVRLVAGTRTRKRGGSAARVDPAARRRRAPELGQRSRARCRQPFPRAPARLLPVPQPAVAEGATDRRGHRLSARRADLRGAGAARRRAAALGVVAAAPGRNASRTRWESCSSTAAPRPRRSGGARRRARIPSGSSRIGRSSLRAEARARTSNGVLGR